jgi:acetyl-CoA C-acetyltransferase
MSDVFILGAGMHAFGRFPEKSYQEIGAETAVDALNDAGVRWNQIEIGYLARMFLPATSGARILRRLGSSSIPICDIEAACASGGAALRQAALSIRAGEADLALVIGVEKMPRGFMDPAAIYERWQIEMGITAGPSYWAMRARQHMHVHGTTEEQIARVAFKNHRNSVHNPLAMHRRAYSMDEILGSRLVCDPIRLLEICSPNEGAAAVVLGSKRAVAQFGRKPIALAACEHSLAQYSADFRGPVHSLSVGLNHPTPTQAAAAAAYRRAGLGPNDVDCFEVQDTDAFCEIEAYEELGLCASGEGGALIDAGVTDIVGAKPVNMSGGLISKGEPVGASHLGQIVELVAQLRGEAGIRQVAGARVGLAHVLGAGGNCVVTILQS